jgi:hypothetical protein
LTGGDVADLLSVVIGGLLAIGGGAGTQWYLHKLRTEEERRGRRAAKFEELVAALYEHEHWLQIDTRIKVYGEASERTVNPIAKIEAITAVYFSEFMDDVAKLRRAATQCEAETSKAALQRIQGKTEGLGKAAVEAYSPYQDCLLNL